MTDTGVFFSLWLLWESLSSKVAQLHLSNRWKQEHMHLHALSIILGKYKSYMIP